MKKFIFKFFVFSIPAILITALVIYIDFFKIFGFQDYYSNQKIALNREMITTTTFNNFREEEEFNSFIFGSSRSQAYKCKNWTDYLDDDAIPFHFDASGESIWGVSKKVEYIDELGDSINNVLLVIDRELLSVTYMRKGHLLITMPCVSKSSKIKYYTTFLNSSLNLKFLTAYFDYSIFKTYRDYMEYLIINSKHEFIVNEKNCDIWLGWDREIESDSLEYYSRLIDKGVFYERPIIGMSESIVTPDEKKQLENIKSIFDKHNTKYKIIISPLYDQIPFEEARLVLLEQIFGKENIYNFSGENKFTENIYNFYETSHYRPHIADEILDFIYNEK